MSSTDRTPRIRRRAYRVRPESLEELDLAVLERRYKVVRGEVADVTSGGARVSFERSAAPAIADEESVLLAIASDRYDVDATLRAVLVDVVDDGHRRAYRFAFDADAPLGDQGAALFSLFNRRAAWRRPATAEPALSARARPLAGGPATSVPITVTDLSAVGLGFRVPGDAPSWLLEAAAFTLELALPGGPSEHLACRVRRREAHTGRLACEFDWQSTPDAAERAARILAWVQAQMAGDRRLAPDRRCPPP